MAISEWYVDPVSGDNANAGTSDAAAWATLNYAAANATVTANEGGRINLKDNGTHTLTANIAAWAGGTTSTLQINGYTSTADDGGIATIECNGFSPMSGGGDYMGFRNLLVQNTGSSVSNLFSISQYVTFSNVEFNDCNVGSSVLYTSAGGNIALTADNCVFTNINARCINNGGQYLKVRNCHFYNSGAKTITRCVEFRGAFPEGNFVGDVSYNIFNLSSTSNGLYAGGTLSGYGDHVYNNTFYTTGSGVAYERTSDAGNIHGMIINNIFEGWSTAIRHIGRTTYKAEFNHFYDNTNDYYSSPTDGVNTYITVKSDNFEAAGASVLAKSGSNTHANRFTYFEPTGDAIDGASNGLYIGAVPPSSSGGGGGGGLVRVPGMGGGFNT